MNGSVIQAEARFCGYANRTPKKGANHLDCGDQLIFFEYTLIIHSNIRSPPVVIFDIQTGSGEN